MKVRLLRTYNVPDIADHVIHFTGRAGKRINVDPTVEALPDEQRLLQILADRASSAAKQLKPIRQIVESVFDTLKGQLSLEQHGGHSQQGVLTRVLQRLLALTAAIWHNHHTSQPVLRSLTAYDH